MPIVLIAYAALSASLGVAKIIMSPEEAQKLLIGVILPPESPIPIHCFLRSKTLEGGEVSLFKRIENLDIQTVIKVARLSPTAELILDQAEQRISSRSLEVKLVENHDLYKTIGTAANGMFYPRGMVINGVAAERDTVIIERSSSLDHMIKTLCHELTHALDVDHRAVFDPHADQKLKQISRLEAELLAYNQADRVMLELKDRAVCNQPVLLRDFLVEGATRDLLILGYRLNLLYAEIKTPEIRQLLELP